MKGGSSIKKKIKNITKMYKMKNKKTLKRKIQRMNKKVERKASLALSLSRSLTRSRTGGKKGKRKMTKKRHLRGGSSYPQSIPYPPGYSQYQNNLPLSQTYSVGGVLPANELGLANPPPISVLSNCTNCVDNYNHYTIAVVAG